MADPPSVCLTRWCTWLRCAFWLYKNFENIKKFVDAIDEENKNTACINLKILMQNSELKKELKDVSKFEFLVIAITSLEEVGLESSAQIEIVENVLSQLKGDFKKRLRDSLDKNPDFSKFLDTDSNDMDVIEMLRYAPMTSVDVERSFSMLKAILAPRREGFTIPNLEQYFLINYNAFL